MYCGVSMYGILFISENEYTTAKARTRLNLSDVYKHLVTTLLIDLPDSFIDCIVFHRIP